MGVKKNRGWLAPALVNRAEELLADDGYRRAGAAGGYLAPVMADSPF